MMRTARSSIWASINTNYSWLSSQDFPCGAAGKESACNVGDLGLIPGLGRSPGEGHGNPLQYSGLENFMECLVHEVAQSWTRLSDFHSPFLSLMAVQYVPVVSSASFGQFFPQACMVFSQAYSDSTQVKAQGSPLYTSAAISQCGSLDSSTLFYKHQPCWLFLTQLHLSLETAGLLMDPPSQNLEAWTFSPDCGLGSLQSHHGCFLSPKLTVLHCFTSNV